MSLGYGLTEEDRRSAEPRACARALASGASHTCILYANGSVACLGAGASGQLGHGATDPALTPVAVRLGGISAIAAGGDHTCAAGSDEAGAPTFHCWGSNASGEIGPTGPEGSATPLRVEVSSASVLQLVAGEGHTCALDLLDHVHCWGRDATGAGSVAPRQLAQLTEPVFRLEGGAGSLRVIDEAGRPFDVPDWGAAGTRVGAAGRAVVQSSRAGDHECLLKAGGTAWCRGAGYYEGFYGVALDFGRDVAEIDSGDGFTCARSAGGAVLCRGVNDSGQLGDGSAGEPRTTARPAAVDGVVELSLGRAHACALRRDGSVWCWGTMAGGPSWPAPQVVSEPADPAACAAAEAPTVAVPSQLAAAPIRELVDAIPAWGQALCACAYRDQPETDEAAIVDCVLSETRLLGGCLEALAHGAAEAAGCHGQARWSSAECWARCEGPELPTADCVPAIEQCAPATGPLLFCQRGLVPCDADGSLEIRGELFCDGKVDCPNAFDEANCTPFQPAFNCADGGSVPLEALCDAKQDCADASDERTCY